MYLLVGINNRKLWNTPREKYFVLLKILYLFVKSFVNTFVDESLILSDNSSNSFPTSTCFVLFEEAFLILFLF